MKENYMLLKTLLEGLKGEYSKPAKALLWAMAVGQWMVIIFFGSFFLFSVLKKSFCE